MLLSPPICPVCLLLLLTMQTLRWPLFCIANMVIILRFLWLSTIGLICSFTSQMLGIYWLSQNYADRFSGIRFIIYCLLATLVPKRFVLYYLGMFGYPMYCCLANKLCLFVLFLKRISPLLSLSLVYCNYYPFQKASLYPRVLILSWMLFYNKNNAIFTYID